ncbi:MAG: hypothetical protein JWO05_1298 [Gemmatimonadetes bacterium]|nr:hypothetical protein [Gemmatimonadota bacterium]
MAHAPRRGRSLRVTGHELERDRDVSVVLAVRNGARLVADAIESILAQTATPREIIVVDGASHDETRDIAARYPLVRVMAQRSTGIGGAWNEGIEASAGATIAFLSHDDIWLPEKLHAQLAHLAGAPHSPGCVTHVVHELLPGTECPPAFRAGLLGRPVPGWIMESLLVRRGVFDLVGRFDSQMRIGEDTDWFARARDKGVMLDVLSGCLVRKRVHGANITLTQSDAPGVLLDVLRRSIARKREGAEA